MGHRPLSYVTSVGAVTPLGTDWPVSWASLLEGASRTRSLPADEFGVTLQAPVSAVEGIDRRLEERTLVMGPALRLALRASREACEQAPGQSLRLYGGSTHGESDAMLALARGESSIPSPCHWRSILTDPLPSQLADALGPSCRPGAWVYSSCTSGISALCAATCELCEQRGAPWSALVVGVDALSALGVSGFARAGAATKTKCMPFRKQHDGTLVAEGAAAMVVCERPFNGPFIRIDSIGLSCDADHPTRPDPTGLGIERAVRAALAKANLTPGDMSAVFLHGSGTPVNDVPEAMAVLRIFGVKTPPCTSLKGSMGHTMAAAGLMNCLAAVETCRTGLVPPTNGEGELVNAGVDLVQARPRELEARGEDIRVLCLCSGFGGNNAAVILTRETE